MEPSDENAFRPHLPPHQLPACRFRSVSVSNLCGSLTKPSCLSPKMEKVASKNKEFLLSKWFSVMWTSCVLVALGGFSWVKTMSAPHPFSSGIDSQLRFSGDSEEPRPPSSHSATWAEACQGALESWGSSSKVLHAWWFSAGDSPHVPPDEPRRFRRSLWLFMFVCVCARGFLLEGMNPNEIFYGPVDLLIVPQVLSLLTTHFFIFQGDPLGSALLRLTSLLPVFSSPPEGDSPHLPSLPHLLSHSSSSSQ